MNILAAYLTFALSQSSTLSQADNQWKLMATFRRLHIVLIDRRYNTNESVYRSAAKILCGEKVLCEIMFWDDPAKVPLKLPASNEKFAAETAEWHQNLQTGHRELLIACRLLKNRVPCLARY